MPPRVPVQLSWSSRCSVQPANSISTTLRTFTTTLHPLALGPESPNYIEVPKPVQPTWPHKPIVKGVLPVPRDVFKTRNSLPKVSDEFISQSTPLPKNQREPSKYSKDADYILYKRRLAESRRQALREGVNQLYERKVETDKRLSAQSKFNQERNKAFAMAPERQSDALTSTTVQKDILDYLADKLPSTRRAATPRQIARFQRLQARHEAVRKAHLHDLYTHARDFVVTEEQLDALIEKEFGSEEEPIGWEAKTGEPLRGKDGVPAGDGPSPWVAGPQDGVGEMMNRLRSGESIDVAKERNRRVAEEFTGEIGRAHV